VSKISLHLLAQSLFGIFYDNSQTPDAAGDEIIRQAGEQIKILYSTNSKEKIDQENSKRAERDYFSEFMCGANLRAKKILKKYNEEKLNE
jgi:hypothetical protein